MGATMMAALSNQHFARTFLSVLLLVAPLVRSASGLSCVHCVSLDTPRCQEGDLPAKPCTDENSEAKYCLKSFGTMLTGHGHFVIRTCTSTLQTNCTHEQRLGVWYNVCHYSCTENGCNGSNTLRPGLLVMIFIFFTVALSYQRYLIHGL